MTQRRAVFESNYLPEEFSPSAEWHTAAVSEAGFAEVGVVWVGVVWRSGTGAVVPAVR
jgi:hypothetical protein